MNYIIEGTRALVNQAGAETPLKAGDFTLVDPSEKTISSIRGTNLLN